MTANEDALRQNPTKLHIPQHYGQSILVKDAPNLRRQPEHLDFPGQSTILLNQAPSEPPDSTIMPFDIELLHRYLFFKGNGPFMPLALMSVWDYHTSCP